MDKSFETIDRYSSAVTKVSKTPEGGRLSVQGSVLYTHTATESNNSHHKHKPITNNIPAIDDEDDEEDPEPSPT